MFNSKQTNLLGYANKQTSGFLNTGKGIAATTVSGNGAEKFSTTGDPFVDQFGSVGMYKKPRPIADIWTDMAILWRNPRLAVMFVLYIRMITRITQVFNSNPTNSVQKGAGLRFEGISRMLWLAIYHPDIFWRNINLFISVGSWKDIIMMLSYDLQYHGWEGRKLNWDQFGKLLLAGLENPNSTHLIRKYLPQIKANSACRTLEAQADNIIAKWICSLVFGSKSNSSSYKAYRKLKSEGTAHTWQQLISQGKHKLINFDTVHGRALAQMVSSKYLKNHGLEQVYAAWIANKPVAKFTGFVYELASNIGKAVNKYQQDTINAQYNTLLEAAGKLKQNYIVVKDTSHSMDSTAHGTNMSSYHIAKSLSIFMGNMIQGWFHNHYIDFSTEATLREIQGTNFVDHWKTEQRLASANTNFLAVAKLFVNIRKKGVSEDEFPQGIILISDGEFDKTNMFDKTNIEAFKTILRERFSANYVNNLKFVFWDIHNTFYGNSRKTKFETFGPQPNVFYLSGFDPSVITFLTGVEGKANTIPTTAAELFRVAMDQEILQMVQV